MQLHVPLLLSLLCPTGLALQISLWPTFFSQWTPFSLLQGPTYSDEPFPMPHCQGVVLEEATIADLHSHIMNDSLTSVQLLECYLEHISQVNPYLSAVQELNPDAHTLATALDFELHSSGLRSILHGLPFLVKDNIATADRMSTAAGSNALIGSVVPRDAHVVKKLREAGALLLGHASMAEWAAMRSTNFSEGYSARGGQARNPYNLSMSGGGSSTGSAAAVAANLAVFALGTETDGSVVMPAERAGLVGLKPTVGLTSRAGVIPESDHFDTVGVLARSVADAAAVLGVIGGVDERDGYTLEQIREPGRTFDDYTQFLAGPDDLRGAVFGLPWQSFWVHAQDDNMPGLLSALNSIEKAGGRIINGTELPNYKTIISPDGWDWDYGTKRGYPNESEYTVVKVDFYNNIATYLSELHNTSIRTLADIVAYNYAHAETEGGVPGAHPAFASGQDGLLASLATKGERDRTYWQALEYCRRGSREEGIDAALKYTKEDGTEGVLDGLLVPSSVLQHFQVSAQAGYPLITIPVGLTSYGMPFGLGIMHTAWSEARLIRWGSAIEAVVRGRRKPGWSMWWAKNIPVWEG